MALHVHLGSLAASLSVARMVAGLCVASLIPLFVSLGAAAESWPSRPIRLLIGFPPGGPADIPGRAIAERLSQSLGTSVVAENKPGAGGMLATQELISLPADGYTLSICTYFDPVNTLLYRKARYKVSDIAPVSLIGTYDYVLAVANSVPADTLSKLVEISKASPDKFNYGHIGIGSPANLIFKQLEKRTGIKMTAVPFKGSAPAMQEVLAGATRSLYRAADQCGSSLRCQTNQSPRGDREIASARHAASRDAAGAGGAARVVCLCGCMRRNGHASGHH